MSALASEPVATQSGNLPSPIAVLTASVLPIQWATNKWVGITFTTPPNLQAAVAYGLGKADGYFEGMRADFQRSRDRFTAGLRSLGFPVIDAQATYFVNVDLASLGLNEDDETFCKRLVLEHKVAAIPVSAFYANDPIRSVVRFCFAKRDATLDAALERLAGALKRGA